MSHETTTEPNVRRFALDKIYVENNAREDFDPDRLQELAESIKDTKGSLQPLLGTLMPDGRVKLIAGNRRLIATGMAGFTDVEVKLMPVVSRKEFLKWNLVENVQREDLKPLEKAKRIKDMLELTDEESGLPVYNRASLAHEIGLSAETIGKFEALMKAPEKVQKEVNENGLDYTVGALIGALPASLHERAQKEIIFRSWGGPMKRREAQEHVAECYRRDLRKAQFDRKDAELVPDAGPCEACPFFGGNRDDVDGKSRGYTCLNPECFDAKQQAHVNRVAATATEEGTTVLGQNMTDRVFQDWNNQVNPSCGYVDLKDVPDGYLLKDPKVKTPSWDKILKGAGVPFVIGLDHEGKVRRLVELKLAVEAVKHGDHADKFKANAAANLETVDDKKHTAQISKAKNKASAAALIEGCCEMLLSFSGQRWNREVRLAFLTQICEAGHTKDDMELLCQILQPDLKSVSNPTQKLPELVDLYVTTDEQLDAFILIARNIRHIRYQGFHHIAHRMTAYCEWAGFDAEAWKTKSEERIKEAEKTAKAAIREKVKAAKKAKGKTEKVVNATAPAPGKTAMAKAVSDPRVVLCEFIDSEDTADMIEALLNHEVPVTEPNEHGVFVRRAVFSCELATKVKFEIALAVDAGGVWHSCVSYQRGDAIGNQPGADCPDRNEAVREAAIKLIEEFEKPTKLKTYEGARKEALGMMHEIYGAGLGVQPAATKGGQPVKGASRTKAKAAEQKTDWNGFASAAELDVQVTRIQAGEGYPAVLGPRPVEGTPARKTWEAAKVRIWKEVKKREAARSSKNKAEK